MARKEPWRVVEGRSELESPGQGRRSPSKGQKKQPQQQKNGYLPEAYWWATPLGVPEDEILGLKVHEKVAATTQDLISRQKSIFERDKKHVFAYMNANMRGLAPHSYSKRGEEPSDFIYNLLQQIIEALMSHFATKKTRPQILTNAGDPTLQKRAKNMQAAIDGLFYEVDFYVRKDQAVLDGSVLDFGAVKHYEMKTEDGLRPAIERLPPWEVLVDDAEGFYGDIPNLGIHKSMSCDKLAALDYKGSIWEGVTPHLNAATLLRDDSPGTHETLPGKLVSVVEFFHPESEFGSGDGRHFIGLSNFTSVYEEWNEPIPVTFFKWLPHVVVGWRSQGICERLYELNEKLKLLLARCQKVAELESVKVFVQNELKLAKNQWTNEDMTVHTYSGTQPPTTVVVGSIPPEWMELVRQYIQWGKDLIGVSDMAVSASKPAGITANNALETLQDVQSKRLASPEIALDNFVIECTKAIIRRCDSIDKKMGGKFKVMLKRKGSVTPMLWKDCRVKPRDYRMQVFPSNYLPMNPGARLQKVMDLAQSVPELRPFFLDLLDFPDIEAKTKLLAAPIVWMLEFLENVVEEPDTADCAVEETWDMDTLINLTNKFIAVCHNDGVEERRIDLLRRVLANAVDQKKKLIAAQQPPPPPVNQMGNAQTPGMPMPLQMPQGAPGMPAGMPPQ